MVTRTGGVLAAVAALLYCGGPPMSAQEPAPGQAPTFRSGVELVTLDVGVVDKQGQPLRGLNPADFTVTVAGQPRRVVTAEFVDVAGAQANMAAHPDIDAISTNEGVGIGRMFVFIVDRSTLEPGMTRQVATAASRFFSKLTFADRSALMLLPIGPNIPFTWAHERVREGLQRVSGMASPNSGWEYGSLSEARDIANRNLMAVRNIADRECRNSIFAGGGGGGGAPAGAASGASPVASPSGPPGGGGGSTGGGETGGAGGAPGGGGGGGGTTSGVGARAAGGGAGFAADACTRSIQMQAESTWREAQMTTQSSLAALRQMLSALERVRGDKTIILISGGWPMDDRDEMSTLSTIAAQAAAARATFFTVFIPGSPFSADRRNVSFTPAGDQYLRVGPLETLAGMTGGGSFRADVNADAAFDRLTRELAGYYRLAVEKDPSDSDGKGRRMNVQVSRSGATVRARGIFDVRTYEDRDWAARLASALESPVAATGVGLKVTSYLSTDPEDRSRLTLVLAGEASRLQPGEATFQVLVRDMDGKRVLAGEQPLGDATGDSLPFSTNISLSPGSYIVRLAVMDSAGRVGAVDHRVEARQATFGTLSATGPLLVRVPSRSGAEPRIAFGDIGQDERLAMEVNLDGEKDNLARTDVEFEIAATAEGPALVHAAAAVSPGRHEDSAVAQGVAEMRLLPPGQYIARAKITSGGTTVGEMKRSFVVTGALSVPDADSGAPSTVASRTTGGRFAARAVGAVAPFALDQVLAPQVLGAFLSRVAARPDAASPVLRELLERARTGGVDSLVIPDALADEMPVAAFLKGLTLLSQKQLDPAANAFRSAMRASADFYPAMVYLGACYAAGGKDKEAAGAWRTALIKEGDAAALHGLLADALMRQGRGEQALQDLDVARTRWPDDNGLKRKYAVAALVGGRYAEGLQAVDELLDKRVQDESSLAFALLVLYEAFVSRSPIQTPEQDGDRMTRFADAYRAAGGPSQALVDTWVAAARKR